MFLAAPKTGSTKARSASLAGGQTIDSRERIAGK